MRFPGAFFALLIVVQGATFSAGAQTDHGGGALLGQTAQLLEAVDEDVRSDLAAEAERAEAAAQQTQGQALGTIAAVPVLPESEREVRARRDRLLEKVTEWARTPRVLQDILDREEISAALEEATGIANYYGLDTARLQRLYELGKRTIRRASFATPELIPPDKDESLGRYFKKLFIFAEELEYELAEYNRRNQEYRARLYKRVTFAYIRALLAAAEEFPSCKIRDGGTITVRGEVVPTLGCRDPVVEELRAYVKGLQSIAEADADTFAVEAEKLIADQTLVGDVAAAIPLVGEAIDYYSLYSGEDLAGQCLSRLSYGITAAFSVIPLVPSSWAKQIVQRSGLEDVLAKVLIWGEEVATWGAGGLDGLAVRFGAEPDALKRFAQKTNIEFDISDDAFSLPWFRGDGTDSVSRSQAEQLLRQLDEADNVRHAARVQARLDTIADPQAREAARKAAATAEGAVQSSRVTARNVQLAEQGQRTMRQLTRELREKMAATSRRIMDGNLFALPANARALRGDFSAAINQSNMVDEHVEAFLELARKEDAILGFRAVNPDAARLLRENYGTKWMDVKGKSADWGPQRGFIPVDQNFSKLNNPAGKLDADGLKKVSDFQKKVGECLGEDKCFKIDLALPDGDAVHVLKKGDVEIPVLKGVDGRFRDPDSGAILDVAPGSTRPLEVLAGPNASGELVPLTADYDFLAMGTRSDVQAPAYSDATGFVTREEEALIGKVNEAGKKAGYSGGNLAHHGPENQFYLSPGALAEDPVVTMLDPQHGVLSIPRCDYDCMKQWCKTSGQCGQMPICQGAAPKPPCLHVDPDRLLKDYFHDARLRGYTNLRPNAAWRWGEMNGLSGWTPLVVLEAPGARQLEWIVGQYRPRQGMQAFSFGEMRDQTGALLSRVAGQGMQYLFSCPK